MQVCHLCSHVATLFTLHAQLVPGFPVYSMLLSERWSSSALLLKSSRAARVQLLCSLLNLSTAEEDSRCEAIIVHTGWWHVAQGMFLAEPYWHRIMLTTALWLLNEARLCAGSPKQGQTISHPFAKSPVDIPRVTQSLSIKNIIASSN